MDGSLTQASEEERQQRLADRLREAREYLGLSQQFVADLPLSPVWRSRPSRMGRGR